MPGGLRRKARPLIGMTENQTRLNANAVEATESDPSHGAQPPPDDGRRAGLRGENRAIALTLLGIAVVMLVSAVGIAILVLHVKATHALP
jgi:hypothetical protein